MKILLVSDTHRDVGRIVQVLAACRDADLIIHCGDVDRDCDYIAERTYACPFLAVCGNNDYFSSRPYSLVDEVEGHRIYITHGHKERVKSGYSGLVAAAKANGGDMAFFGHTHRQTDTTEDGIHLINPGALCGMYGSYALLTVTKDAVCVDFHVL